MGRCKLADIKYNNRKVGDTMKEKLEKWKKMYRQCFLPWKKGDALICKTVCGADGGVCALADRHCPRFYSRTRISWQFTHYSAFGGADGKMYSKLGLGAVQSRFGGHLEKRQTQKVVLCHANYYFLADYYLVYRKSNFLKWKAQRLSVPCAFLCAIDYALLPIIFCKYLSDSLILFSSLKLSR